MLTAQELIDLGDINKIKTELMRNKPALKVDAETCINQFDPLKHDVFDEVKRPKKMIQKATGNRDDKGNPTYATSQEEVARISLPYQDLIVERAIGFLLGNPVQLDADGGIDGNAKQDALISMIRKIWTKNKLDYRNKDIARKLFSECEVAELWYLVDAEDDYWGDLSKGVFKPKVRILAQSLGDILLPYFDLSGDMIAFGRQYNLYNGSEIETRFDLYTKDVTVKWLVLSGVIESIKPNPFGKIPIVYYRQEYPEWYKVQSMIERFETSISNRSDSNDYSGSPITVVKGKLEGFASKGEQGKVLQVAGEGDVKYLESNNAPESVKLEWEILEKCIYSMSQTPDISFAQMKGIGRATGIALKLMFLDAHMKARTKEAIFGEGIQRRLNMLIAIVGKVIDLSLGTEAKNITIEPRFTPYLPLDEKLEIDTISVAKTAGVMSMETGVRMNPLVSDPEAEIQRIKDESAQSLGTSFN